MENYSVTCTCQTITLNVDLPLPLNQYSPRACDCTFCTERGLAYISDPNGVMRFSPREQLDSFQQGSEQATFWACKACSDFVAVTFLSNGVEKGAACAGVLNGKYALQECIPASPKKLTGPEKAERWSTLWSTIIH